MRDLYTRDIEEVLVEGDEGYRSAKRLMTMLMPSRARLVKQYREEMPLFFAYRVEDQLDAMHSPTVQLPSGGSIVIHTTEALTAIDVNSGRSTRERHIDETAVKTNLEAADEVARQLRLRDLAGLIVIDFIDMAEGRHQRAVEKRLRDALKADRARIQIGRISQFGLMELSRQRLRASLQELSSQVCPHCAGLGVVRSTESCALQTLRAIQEAGIRGDGGAMRDHGAGRGGALSAQPEARGAVPARAALRHARDGAGRPGSGAARDAPRDHREARPGARARAGRGRARRACRAGRGRGADRGGRGSRGGRRRRPEATASAAAAPPRPPRGEEGEEGGARRRRKRRRRRRRPSEAGPRRSMAARGQAQAPSGDEDEAAKTAAEPPWRTDADEPSPSRGSGRACRSERR